MINIEQALREAVPDRCRDCYRMDLIIPHTADELSADDEAGLEAAKQAIAEDLNRNCRYGQRVLGIVATCRYGVLCEFPSYEDRSTLDGLNIAID